MGIEKRKRYTESVSFACSSHDFIFDEYERGCLSQRHNTHNISIQCRCRPLTFLQAQFLCLFFLHVTQLLLTTPLCLMDSCEIKSGIYWTFLSLMYNSLLRLYWSAPWQLGKREKKHLTRYKKKNFTRDRKAVEVRQEGNFIQRNARRWSCCDNNWITQRLRSFNIHPHYHYSTNSRKCRFFEMQSRCVGKSFVFFISLWILLCIRYILSFCSFAILWEMLRKFGTHFSQKRKVTDRQGHMEIATERKRELSRCWGFSVEKDEKRKWKPRRKV